MPGDGQWFYIRKWAYSRKLREEQDTQPADTPPVKKEEGKHA